jgi:4-hydroxybenzoate polyprenyltransferase
MLEKLRRFGRLIKIEHTLFALPFSLGSLVLAARGWPPRATLGWVLLAIVAGRSFAMAANRVIDRHVDAKNPRTQARELPSGQLSLAEVLIFMAVTGTLLIWAVLHLPPLCLKLLPIAMALLIGYSYTKFFTPLCHVVLGVTLAVPVIGARIALTGEWEWASLWLGLAVMCWVCGFDILYACQDIEFDRAEGLHSIPSRIGPVASLRLALALHVVVVPALATFGLCHGYPWRYFAGMAVIAGILAWEHSICRGADLRRVEQAFFDANVMVSFTFLATACWTAAAL